MTKNLSCALLAESHSGLADGIRSLLLTLCKAVIIVGDERSLLETVGAIDPRVVVLDLSFVRTDLAGFMSRLRSHSPDARIIILSGHVERQVVQTMLDFGAASVVIKGRIASDLVPAVEAVLGGERGVA